MTAPVRQLCASQTPEIPETTGNNRTLNRSGMRDLAFQSQPGQMYFI